MLLSDVTVVYRIIFITRNPKDTAVSLFHHMKNKDAFTFDGDWTEFFDHVRLVPHEGTLSPVLVCLKGLTHHANLWSPMTLQI